jgi:multiple sugar transport system substrate-binding protein
MVPEQREALDEIIVKIRSGRMTRRTFLERAIAIGLTSSVAGSLLEACGGGGGGGGGGPTNIVWTSENDTSGTYKTIADNFNKTNKDNIHVTWNNGPSSTDQLLTNYRTMLRARGRSVDVMSIDVIYPAEFASNQWAVMLDDKWPASDRANYLSGPIKSCTYNGHLWAAPFRTDVGLIYYRTDIVSTAPNSWDDLTNLAKQNKSKSKYGYVWQGAQYEGLVCDFIEVLHGYGGAVLDPNDSTKVTVNSPEAVQALTRMVSWVNDISPIAVTNYTEEPSRSTWQNGDSIFMRNWPYAYSLGNQSGVKIAGKFDIHPMLYGGSNTTGHSAVGGWNLAINAFSPNTDASWKFIQYMLGSYAQKQGALGATWTTTLKSVYDDPDVQAKQPLFTKLKPVLETSLPRPVSPRYTDVSAAIQLRVHQALTKQSSPADALKALETDLNSLVK